MSDVNYYAVESPRVTRIFKNKLVERQDQIAKQIAKGQALDYAAYMRAVGRIEGLEEALNILTDIETKER